MEDFFAGLLKVSVQGGVVILAVIMLRLMLKKAPKSTICLLWLLAGLRLLLPFEIETSFSLQPRHAEMVQNIVQQIEEVPQNTSGYAQEREEILDTEGTVLVQPQAPAVTQPLPQKDAAPVWNWEQIAPYLWLTGAAALGLYSLASYLRLKRKVRNAVILSEGVWVTGGIDTAFVLGFVRPQIYLPVNLTQQEQEFVLAHERSHIARRDHWWKLLGFTALALHWFNPLVWVAYSLLCRDLEMACDESVVKSMDVSHRKAYSAALVSCSSIHHTIAACPVAFGEVSVKARVNNVLKFKKPGFWIILAVVIAVVFVAVFLMTSPEPEFLEVDIPSLTYTDSGKAYRVSERFNPSITLNENTKDYESDYAIYHFDSKISEEDRNACVFYSDGILSRMGLETKPEIIVIDGYDGAWVDEQYLYIGGDFVSIDYGAKLITLLCGGYANYGAAYGYADYIAVEEGWKEATDWQTHLTDNAARDLNWLCFQEGFVSGGEIEINQNTAIRFTRDYIGEYGEESYQALLRKSGDVETVAEFNEALSGWYASNGLTYTPTEILYSVGGTYHEYLVKYPYATFYLPENWNNRWYSEITADDNFLHRSYERVKHCFETNASYMAAQQARLGFDSYDNDLTVEFMTGEISSTSGPYRLIRLNSIEDLPILYVYWLTWNPQRTRTEAMVYPYYLYVGMADYIAVTAEHPYEADWLRYCGKNGQQAQLYQENDGNKYIVEILEGETDPAVIQRTRWDFGTYYVEDYYDKPGNGLATSFVWYLIEKYGFETMFDYVYETGREPISLDLNAEQDAWIAYLEEKYGEYPKYSDYAADENTSLHEYSDRDRLTADDYLEMCRTALDAFQSKEVYAMEIDRQFSGPDALHDGSTQTWYGSGDDWLRKGTVSGVEPSDEEWYLVKDGEKYSRYIITFDNPVHGESSDTGWVKGFQTAEGEINQPWLRTLDWEAQEITFVEWRTEGDAQWITFTVHGDPYPSDRQAVAEYQVTLVLDANAEL